MVLHRVLWGGLGKSPHKLVLPIGWLYTLNLLGNLLSCKGSVEEVLVGLNEEVT